MSALCAFSYLLTAGRYEDGGAPRLQKYVPAPRSQETRGRWAGRRNLAITDTKSAGTQEGRGSRIQGAIDLCSWRTRNASSALGQPHTVWMIDTRQLRSVSTVR